MFDSGCVRQDRLIGNADAHQPGIRMTPRRRIFRGSATRRPNFVRALLIVTAFAGGAGALAAIGLPINLLRRAPPTPSTVSADAGRIAVIDGETLRLENQIVRLRGIEAPDRGDRCRGDLDCGGAATSALAGLVRGRRVECALDGHDQAGRPYAACEANGTDLSRAIVASGWARAMPGAPELADLELHARRQRFGLWADAGLR